MPRSYRLLPEKDCYKNKAKSVVAQSVVENVIYVAMYHVNDSETMCALYFFFSFAIWDSQNKRCRDKDNPCFP